MYELNLISNELRQLDIVLQRLRKRVKGMIEDDKERLLNDEKQMKLEAFK